MLTDFFCIKDTSQHIQDFGGTGYFSIKIFGGIGYFSIKIFGGIEYSSFISLIFRYFFVSLH